MSKDARPPLLIREQFEATLESLTDAERGKLLSALTAYQWHGELPAKLSEKLSAIFMVFKSFADDDVRKYQEKSEKNRKSIQEYWDRVKGNSD